jgi:AcrR family transcriptional regulator
MVPGRRGSAAPPRREVAPPRRADAERNIAAIVAAGVDLFSRQASVSMADVARAAGVGRVTLYAHFPSRKDLLAVVLARAIEDTTAALDRTEQETDRDEPADQLLARLVSSSWQVVDRHRRLRPHAVAELGPEGLREGHDPVRGRLEHLIVRGQQDGIFRTDLPVDWLVTAVFSLLHTAADEVNAGRLAAEAAPRLVNATSLAALAPPPRA